MMTNGFADLFFSIFPMGNSQFGELYGNMFSFWVGPLKQIPDNKRHMVFGWPVTLL